MRIMLYLALGTVAACGSSLSAGGSDPADAWRERAIASSRFHLTDMCKDVAPASVRVPGNPDLAACAIAARIAIDDEREAMRAEALRQCERAASASDASCCLARTANSDLDAHAQSQCNQACATRTGRPVAAGPPEWCHPIPVTSTVQASL